MSGIAETSLDEARDSAARNDWLNAFEILSVADAAETLGAEDLELLAEAAVWRGRISRAIDAHERAYEQYTARGDRRKAARAAMKLALWNGIKSAPSVAAGWEARAGSLLEGEPESVEHGYLALHEARGAMYRGDVERALARADRAAELGVRFGDRALEAQARARRGMVLVRRGDVADGLALMDEASAAAAGGELDAMATSIVYCNTIETCRNLADYERAAQWTDRANAWYARGTMVGFPGECRIYKAEVLQLHGAWDDATEELRRAWDELRDFCPALGSIALYELGELRLLRGDLSGAEEAFREAHELGRAVQPGLALLHLGQGKVEAAARAIKRALEDQPSERLARLRLLPAQIEIAIAAGDMKTARAAAVEIEAIADDYRLSDCRTTALDARTQMAWGAIALAEQDTDEAVRRLRAAARLWADVDAPYELARTRVLLGTAYRSKGEEDEARADLSAARSTFARLGAVRDEQHAAELLGERALERTFLFTDIVESTQAAGVMSEAKWRKVLDWHDSTLRGIFASHGGDVVKHTGDGFFVAFQSPKAAIEAAVAVQRALDEHPGYAPDVRVGIHAGPAFIHGNGDYGGVDVHAAARIGALAGAGEILASRKTLHGAASPFAIADRGTQHLKGIPDPVEVVSIDWR
jgi:class 3 adenylate cyclase